MAVTVLDASALMALLLDEPGAAEVEAVLGGALISAVNLSEVAGKLAERNMPGAEIRLALDAVGAEAVAFDATQAYEAGALRPATRAAGLSLGDRACLALGRTRGARVLTADAAWSGLDVGVEIAFIR